MPPFVDADSPSSPPLRERFANLAPYMGQCQVFHLSVPPREIGYVSAILESIGHMARIRTADNRRGILEITLTAEWEPVFRAAVAHLGRFVGTEILEDRAAPASP